MLRTLFLFTLAQCIVCNTYAQGINMAADTLSRSANGDIVATGDVEIKRQDETIKADKVHYNKESKQLTATGHVDIISPKAHIQAASATLQTQSKIGELHQANITLPDGQRLQAVHVRRTNKSTFQADNISFSSCPPDAEAWRLQAGYAELDQAAGILTARDVTFKIGDVPVFYLPYSQQPLRRMSGFLVPDFGSSTIRGSEYTLPYYIAPAANWDATLTPRWMTARGFMGEIELRHAGKIDHEKIQWSGLKDKQTNRYRQQVQSQTHLQLGQQAYFYTHINHLSDHQYLADFSLDNTSTSTRFLSSNVGLAWQGSDSDIRLSAQHQQNLTQINDDNTLQILPRLESHYALDMGLAKLHIDQQTTRFDRRVGQDGLRLAAHPWLEIPMQFQQGAIHTTLQAGAHHLRYSKLNNIITSPTQQNRTAYDGSFEARMDFERINPSRTWRHSISPILRYDIATAPNQTNLINFDSGFSRLTLNNLMQGNRFTGYDRFERMQRISFMLENNIQYKSDISHAIARNIITSRVGVAYDLLRQQVDTNIQTISSRPYSNIVGDISISPVQGMRIQAAGQYNPVDNFWPTTQASLMLKHQNGHHLNLRWQSIDARYATPTNTISGNTALQLAPRWKIFANALYDAKLKLTQQARAGIHYHHACWDFKVEGFRNLNNGSSTSTNYGYRFLLGFKGLGSIGDS